MIAKIIAGAIVISGMGMSLKFLFTCALTDPGIIPAVVPRNDLANDIYSNTILLKYVIVVKYRESRPTETAEEYYSLQAY